ncbi:MAG TPA: CDP-archaeol synthase [Candidatus Binatia bacterium]|nr:CDP-archaeol synthase [Candidatus Binatia bacterium]
MNLLALLYFFLPAYVANMMPVIGRNWLPGKPVSAKLFGSHKTWRGLFLGTLGGVVVAGMQNLLVPLLPSLSIAPYAQWWLLGLLLGAGAILGDMLKSFVKRRLGIAPGAPWIPFDQLDFVIGGLALASFVYFPGWTAALVLIVLSFFLHIAVNHLGHALGMRKTAW